MAIQVTDQISLHEKEITWEFVRASGPGGQNVNKVATAVKLYFAIPSSPSLPPAVKDRLLSIAKARISSAGVLIIHARRFRTQEGNRRDALGRLIQLIRQAAKTPKIRHPTRPGAAAKARRLDEKKKLGTLKRARMKVAPGDE